MKPTAPLWQRTLYAFCTVFLTVCSFIFYSVYTLSGQKLKDATGEKRVLDAVHSMGGLYAFGTHLPIWSLILIETAIAFCLQTFVGGPGAMKLALNVFNPREVSPTLFQCTVICSTISIMCPSMSFIATWIFYPYNEGFNFWTLLADYLDLLIHNFPFVYFLQTFLIQPLLRGIVSLLSSGKSGSAASKVEKKEDETNQNNANPMSANEDNNASDDAKLTKDALAL